MGMNSTRSSAYFTGRTRDGFSVLDFVARKVPFGCLPRAAGYDVVMTGRNPALMAALSTGKLGNAARDYCDDMQCGGDYSHVVFKFMIN
ncbi:hypothetical protein LTR95_019161 [Oleoguttula sp. CCFEE 5521]